MNQPPNYSPYQQLPFSNINNQNYQHNQNIQYNYPNTYSNPNENRYPGNTENSGSTRPMNLFNPGMMHATLQQQQIQHQQIQQEQIQQIASPNYQNKLSEEQHYSGSLQENARKSFVSKVYLLLSLQLLITTLMGYFGYNSQTFKDIFVNTWMIILISVFLIALTIVISCNSQFFKEYVLPIFITFTLLISLMVAISICGFQSKIILMAAGITLLMTIALTIYAWKTESDLTGCGVYLMILCLVMFVFGIVAIFWKDPIVHLIYSSLGALLFSVYLIYDTQKVLGQGGSKYSLDDCYMAALMLYLDIIQIFLDLLQILAYFNR